MNDSTPTPEQTAPASQDTAKSALNDRLELLHKLNEADVAFSNQLADYTGGAARSSILGGAAGVAGSTFALRKHLARTIRSAETFAKQVKDMLVTHIETHQSEGKTPSFDDLREPLKTNIRLELKATGMTATPILETAEALFHTMLPNSTTATQRDCKEALLRSNVAELIRNPLSRTAFGAASAVVGSALATGVVGHEIYKAMNPHRRQEVMELARERRRLEQLARTTAPASFEQRVNSEREQAPTQAQSR